MKKLVLASSSPRRHQILTEFKIPFDVILPEVNEITLVSPFETALQNAKLKANDVFQKNKDRIILASDTVVAVDNHVLGKPNDVEDAERILNLISGKKQLVISSYCILGKNLNILDHDVTSITMRKMTKQEIAEYIASGEPFGKAGAYAIQENGDKFVTKIDGSFNNVVGLPIEKILPHINRLREVHLIQ